MKIKEAAQVCGLTEKAIRLYESRGLLSPVIEEKNGRCFREYDDANIRTLTTIAILRRADFSLEQIGEMISSPERISEIFAAYCDDIRINSDRMLRLREVSEKMTFTDGENINDFADRLASLMAGEEEISIPTEPERQSWDEKVSEVAALWMLLPQKVRKLIKIGVPSVLFILFVLNCLFLTTPVSITENGVLYDRGSGEVTPTTITFDGELKRFIWRDDYFTGKLAIDGFFIKSYMIPANGINADSFYTALKIYYEDFFAEIDTGHYLMAYYASHDGHRLSHDFVLLRGLEGDEDFVFTAAVQVLTEANIHGTSYHFSGDDGCYLVFPAESQDDAEFLVRRMWDLYNEEYPSDMPIDE